MKKMTPPNLDKTLFMSATGRSSPRPPLLTALQTFLDVGGSPDVALRWAATDVEYLLVADADIRDASNKALFWAVAHGHVSVVERLLATGADVHAANEYALRAAAMKGHLPVVKHLLIAGADVHAADDAALRLAAEQGHQDVVACLLAFGADVHAGHEQALRAALNNTAVPMARGLLRHGADPVRAWRWIGKRLKSTAASTLDALAIEIHPAQRRALLRVSRHWFQIVTISDHRWFPAMRALESAQRRRAAPPSRRHTP